jgi:hypothetical protein
MKSEQSVDGLNKFVNLLPRREFDRPAKKFVRELVAGIIVAQTLVVTNIARALSTGNSSFRTTYKRLLRRLGEVDILPAKALQQERAFREITDRTIIAIDLGDIAKPASKTLEYLGTIADGSDQHRLKPGYGLLGAVAINPDEEDKTPQPLELKIYSSSSPEFKSENTLLKDFISSIHKMADGRGIHVIDRGGDRGVILEHYFKIGAEFIIRMNRRNLTDVDNQMVFKTYGPQGDRESLPFEAQLQRQASEGNEKRSTMLIRFGFRRVMVTNLETKVDHECTLVTAWSLTSSSPMFLLTTRKVETADDALKIVTGYLARWSVEETYRFLKSGIGLEELRCFSFTKLKNLVAALFIAASFIARMSRASAWRKIFSRVALRLRKAPDRLYNWLYRAADACSTLFSKFLSIILFENRPDYSRRKRRYSIQESLFGDEPKIYEIAGTRT